MQYANVFSVCPYCGAGCGFYLQILDGELVGLRPAPSHPVSQGKLCIKGWQAHEFVTSKDRLHKPLVRKQGKLQETSWDEALGIVAEKLKAAGPEHVAVLSSAKCTNEENYLLQKFARVALQTNSIDHCARLCHSSTVVGLAATFGSGAMTNSIRELEDATCIFVTGSNTMEQHPLVARYIVRAKERGAKLIVADWRRVPLAAFADIHLKQRPGTDVALLNGLMHVIIEEGLENKAFITERTEGFEELKALVTKYTPEHVEKITGVPKDLVVEAARTIGKAEKCALVYCMGLTQHTTGVDNVVSTANLQMLTGSMGRASTGVNPLRGQSNVQGACDMGALPVVYSGYQAVADEGNRKKFEQAWETTLPTKPGLTVVEMTNEAAKGNVKAMYIMGENPMVADPDLSHVREGLEKLDFLVVQDIFLTETAAMADVVLPAASYAEKDGTVTSTERRVQRINKAIEPVGESKPDWQIICALAKRMGVRGFEYDSPAQIMAEVAKLTPAYAGITYERLGTQGLHWPCPTKEHPGTPVLHVGKFSRGLGKFQPREFRDANELPDEAYPLVLTTGRSGFHYHTGTMTRRTKLLNREVPTGYVEINSRDAARLGIADGEMVVVRSRRGTINAPARVTETIGAGVVFVPFHFAECAANWLTNAAIDPVAKIPEYKVCACRVEKQAAT